MRTLFVAWQNPRDRSWVPVGRLSQRGGTYEFVYTRGAETASDFRPFGRMTDLHAVYHSEDLFPLFANRIIHKNRPEYPAYLEWLGLSAVDHDVLEELGRTGGIRATDSLELFPCPEPSAERNYVVHFFARGLRFLEPENLARARRLGNSERLFLMQDLQNPVDRMALLLRTADPVTLVGYAPRYYSAEFTKLIDLNAPENVRVTVERVNQDAPLQYLVLCTLVSPWPSNFSPCAGAEFQAIVS